MSHSILPKPARDPDKIPEPTLAAGRTQPTLGLRFLAAAGLVLFALPPLASAQPAPPPPPGLAYDGYCYQKKNDAAANGAVAGAVAGAVIGSQVAGRGDRASGAAVGAAAGAVIGAEAGEHSVKCYRNAYYVYYEGYVVPPPPPPGYVVVYYHARPPGLVYRPIYVSPRGPGYREGYRRGYYDGRHSHHP